MPTAPEVPALFLDDPIYWVVCSLLIVVGIYISILLHELGHWLFGKACGFRILGFSVGEGRILWRGKIDHCFVHLRLLPIEGYVIPVKVNAPLLRSHDLLVSAGGPVFTALTLAAVAILYHGVNLESLGPTWSILTQQMLAITMVLLLISLVFNLFPRYGNADGRYFANDGMQILTALFSKNYPQPAWYQQSLRHAFASDENIEETPGADEHFLAAQTHHLDGNHDAAEAELEAALRLPGLTKPEKALFLSLSAKFAPLTRTGLEHALQRNEQASALFPNMHHFTCDLALTQIRLRFYDRGRAALDDVLDQTNEAEIRAQANCIHALADAAQNKREDGLKRLDEARKHNRFCPLLPMAKAALLGGTPGFEG